MQTLKPSAFHGATWLIQAVTAPAPIPDPIQPPPVATGTTPNPSFTIAAIPNKTPFPRDAYKGNPVGYATTYGKGWGKGVFSVKVTAAIPALYMRLHKGTDPAAQAGAAGTGAVIQPPVQVSGPLAVGTARLSPVIPGAMEWFYADFDTDPAMPNPVRLPELFGCGINYTGTGTSHAFRYLQEAYIDGHAAHQDPKDFLTLNPFGVALGLEQTGSGDGDWHLPGEVGSTCDSFFAAKSLDMVVKTAGVVAGFHPYAMNGGSTGSWQVNDPNPGHTIGLFASAISRTTKTDGCMWILGPNDRGSFSQGQTSSMMQRLVAVASRVGNNPNMVFSVAASPMWDAAGDGFLEGWRANIDTEKAMPGRVAMTYDFDSGGWWNESNHATQWGRSRYAVAQTRVMLGLLGPDRGGYALRRGPYISSARRVGKVITAEVTHDGGTKLLPYGWQEGPAAPAMLELDPAKITPESLASIPDVFPAGLTYSDLSKDAKTGAALNPSQIKLQVPGGGVASVQIVNGGSGKSQLVITLVNDPGDESMVLDLWWGLAGMGGESFSKVTSPPPGQWMLAIKDDAIDGVDGVTYGRDLRRSAYAVSVIPSQPKPTTLAIDPPQSVIVGQRRRIGGTGSGLPASTLQINGAAPEQLVIRSDNTWSGIMQFPATPGDVPVAISNGPTITVSVRSPRDTLPASFAAQAVALYRADTGMFSDKAGTVPTPQLGAVVLWRDLLGGIGDLTTLGTDPDTAGLLDFNKKDWGGTVQSAFNDPRAMRPSVNFEQVAAAGGNGRVLAVRNPAITNTLQGDVTLIFVADGDPGGPGSGWFQLGNTTDKWGWDDTKRPGFTAQGAGMPSIMRGMSAGVATKALVGGPNYFVVRYNATSGLLRFKDRSGEASVTSPTDALAPFNSFMIGGAIWQGRLLQCWMRLSSVLAIGAELTDDQVGGDLTNYLTAEWPH